MFVVLQELRSDLERKCEAKIRDLVVSRLARTRREAVEKKDEEERKDYKKKDEKKEDVKKDDEKKEDVKKDDVKEEAKAVPYRSEFDCPACLRSMATGPILSCPSGHLVCGDCTNSGGGGGGGDERENGGEAAKKQADGVADCPVCGDPVVGRSVVAERLRDKAMMLLLT